MCRARSPSLDLLGRRKEEEKEEEEEKRTIIAFTDTLCEKKCHEFETCIFFALKCVVFCLFTSVSMYISTLSLNLVFLSMSKP